MNNVDVVRAWTDLDYRATLSADALATVPPHPSGSFDQLLQRIGVRADGDEVLAWGIGTPDPVSHECCGPGDSIFCSAQCTAPPICTNPCC